MTKYTIHTRRPDSEGGTMLSTRFAEASTIHAALALVCGTATATAAGPLDRTLREGEYPVAWSPEPSASRGGSKRHTELFAEAMAAGRTVARAGDGSYVAHLPVDKLFPPEKDKTAEAPSTPQPAAEAPADPNMGMYSRDYIGSLMKKSPPAPRFDPFADWPVESSNADGFKHGGGFGLSPDLQRPSHQISPSHASAAERWHGK